MAAVSAAASAPAKKVDWSTYEYTPCCEQYGFVPHTQAVKIHCTVMQLLFTTTRPLCCIVHHEGEPLSPQEIDVRIARVKQLIPQLSPSAAYGAVPYRTGWSLSEGTGMASFPIPLIAQVLICVKNPTTCHELMALIFQASSFFPNGIVWNGHPRSTLLDLLKLRDPAFHAVVAAELKRQERENDPHAVLDYAALRKQQSDAAAADQKTSASAAKK